MKVELRRRELKNGEVSLYLHIYEGYYIDKETSKIKHIKREESLKLRISKNPKNDIQKKNNILILNKAEELRSKKHLELINRKHDIKSHDLGYSDFFIFMDNKIENSATSDDNIGVLKSAKKQLTLYTRKRLKKDTLLFNEITPNYLEGFKKYLLEDAIHRARKKIKKNTAIAYYSKFRAIYKKAISEGIIEKNPFNQVDNIKPVEVKKSKLTIEDILALKKTPIDDNVIKVGFLFMFYTGLRFSDAIKLKYKDLEYDKNYGHFIEIVQQKTDKIVRIPINDNTIKLIGEPNLQNLDDFILEGLKYSDYNNMKLQRWVYEAGIIKKVTWHIARHSFGQILHDHGVDIATIANLMGDTIKTVIQNYVKVSEKSKRDAIEKLNFLNL